ncbi:MAG: 3-oxoacyl-[acyl-carrier-protein] reductase [Nisaea sp.]|jgi:NAD(P)-dependent dehydrogenase (short-subunit alcohol dehydrogenase family)|nr:3-oxoacyl-[acyl-carrier-protein] reductase [Nisaea sp.]MDA8574470.1 SDR family oxidoreductase [Alphaproteobacteria bacterium]OUX96732.1 MAG: 3-oxoacyl-[acyl-carrier-protein] reductase [Candidatus Endolissoclinum sp. TMED26]
MDVGLAGKRAIITGAGGGIGRQTAQLFANAGAAVFINDIDADAIDAARADIPGLAGAVTDMGDSAAVTTFFEQAVSHLGGLDILVNNVGSAGPTAPVEEVGLDEWNACMAVNLTSTFLCIQAAVPHLRAAGGGSIVSMSSAAGKFGFPLRSPYASAKWAIVGLTRTIALELGRDHIRCNCIQPGPVEGERISRVIQAKAAAEGRSDNSVRDQMAAMTTLRRFVPPTDISALILFLCSDYGASITGQSLSVDSGMEGYGPATDD